MQQGKRVCVKMPLVASGSSSSSKTAYCRKLNKCSTACASPHLLLQGCAAPSGTRPWGGDALRGVPSRCLPPGLAPPRRHLRTGQAVLQPCFPSQKVCIRANLAPHAARVLRWPGPTASSASDQSVRHDDKATSLHLGASSPLQPVSPVWSIWASVLQVCVICHVDVEGWMHGEWHNCTGAIWGAVPVCMSAGELDR